MQHLTKKETEYLSELMDLELLAMKKAKMYATILTDTALSECLNTVASEHENRFSKLLAIVGGSV